MSLARLSLPSITHVLEAEGLVLKVPAPAQIAVQIDPPIGLANAPSSSSTPQSTLMKTADYRDYDLEAEGEELISLEDRFANDAAPVDVETRTIFNERREESDIALQLDKQDHALSIWVKNNLPRLVSAVRKLLPFKVAEVLLRKVGRKLAEL